MIEDGKIVPSEVTVRLLQKAMEKSKSDKFLIDGFPRSDENRAVFERVVIEVSVSQWTQRIQPLLKFFLFLELPVHFPLVQIPWEVQLVDVVKFLTF